MTKINRMLAGMLVTLTVLLTTTLAQATTTGKAPLAVAVRYEGWVPQGNFNPQRCSAEVHYGEGETRIKYKGPFAFYPVGGKAYSGRAERQLAGASVRLVTYPTRLQFETLTEQGTDSVTFNAAMNPNDPDFWRAMFMIQFTTTVNIDGVDMDTAISDCRVNSITWL